MNKILIACMLLLAVTQLPAAGVGDMAPDFTLSGLEGEEITLSDLRGKVVYIFWFGYG
jgi:hypothetical protein